MSVYHSAFARYFDEYATDWVREVSPQLIAWFEGRLDPSRRAALDLCCGGGITLAEYLARGWTPTGVDHSPGMLQVARERLTALGASPHLVYASVTNLPPGLTADVATCLDGALNHMHGEEMLAGALQGIARSVAAGGLLVFDLYEPHHFAHWNNVTVTDRAGTVVAKRGVWDEAAGHGMLRLSGQHRTRGGDIVQVDQVLESWTYPGEFVTSAMASVGLRRVDLKLSPSSRKCHSGSCSRDETPCRTIYAAVREG